MRHAHLARGWFVSFDGAADNDGTKEPVLVTIYIGIIVLAVVLYPFQKHIERFWDVRPHRRRQRSRASAP